MRLISEQANKYGLQHLYHNHDFEFEKQNDQFPYEVLLKETDKDLVKMEIDLYWVTKAGQDPIKLFNEHPGRFPLLYSQRLQPVELALHIAPVDAC